MTFQEYKIKAQKEGVAFNDPILQSLYFIHHNEWTKAHNIAQEIHTKWGSWVHGLLHKIEGDSWNAEYWYRNAGIDNTKTDVQEECDYIAEQYLLTFDL